MHRSLAARLASPLLAATVALLGSATLGAQAMPAPAVFRSGASAMEASALGSVAGAAAPASAMGLAAQTLGWAGSASSGGHAAIVTAVVAPTKAAAPTRTVATTSTAIWWSRYRGTNHVWMPTLGVSKSVSFYACGRSTYPANVVYRWGCGGHNNTYLFGHNFGVFYPLYEAWRAGRLRVGMPVVFADGSGHTRLYRVTTWRVVAPTDSAWAIASQRVPSLTLQTCANAAGTTRLVVRLVTAAR